MDGIINILKPPEMTSFDVVSALRGILKTKKIGHTGTLDPMVSGVLPVCIGKATKAVELLIEKGKTYRCEITLGVTTDTQDSFGKILEIKKVNVSKKKIAEDIMSFEGQYNQIPPMYSAKKINGKKLYQLARAGLEIERESVSVTIKKIEIIEFFGDDKVLFDVECTKGTFIRSLCEDIGIKLGTGAHMSFLLRTQSGSFNIHETVTIQQVAESMKNGIVNDILIPTDTIFKDYPKIILDQNQMLKYKNGMTTVLMNCYDTDEGFLAIDKSLMRVYELHTDLFIGLGEISIGNEIVYIKTKKFF